MKLCEKPTLVWFRFDLRLQDNPALQEALDHNRPVLPLYILDEEGEGAWPYGGASRWWLHHALEDLASNLSQYGLPLILRRGPSARILSELIHETGATSVYWNRRYEPHIIKRDAAIKSMLTEQGNEVKTFSSALLLEPFSIHNKAGKPFQVFTPFWKHVTQQSIPAPMKVNLTRVQKWQHQLPSDSLATWKLLPSLGWDASFYSEWTPTCQGGHKQLESFLKKSVKTYAALRDHPAIDGTSRLSPYLHFGQLSPRQIWQAFHPVTSSLERGPQRYLTEIGWREFSYYLLYHFPHTPTEPLRSEFKRFPWKKKKSFLTAWQKGQTGYPFVDAGMRQLWVTGWMHNRVRMVVASFLVKHLQQPWQEGARWFWDTLVDADLASNTQGWQWTSGCGADAAPYFRVFNPILQGEKFDPQGHYIRRWIPEIASLPSSFIHQPWKAPAFTLQEARFQLGKDYPFPIIDLAEGRKQALHAYETLSFPTQT